MPEQNKRGGHPMFYTLGEEENNLYSAKHYQYATDADPMSNFRLCGDLIKKMLKPGVDPTIAAALCLMSKQIVGVYEIVGEGKTNTVESLEDKLKDIGIYSRIIRILVKEADPSNQYHGPELKAMGFDIPAGATVTGVSVEVKPEIKPGPFCDNCDRLADYHSDTGLDWCAQCAEQLKLNMNYMTLLTR